MSDSDNNYSKVDKSTSYIPRPNKELLHKHSIIRGLTLNGLINHILFEWLQNNPLEKQINPNLKAL